MEEANGCRVIHTMGRNNCGGRCIIHAHVRDGKIEQLTTDTLEAAGDCVPLTACVRGMNYHKTFLGEDRLRYPMKRVGRRGEGKFASPGRRPRTPSPGSGSVSGTPTASAPAMSTTPPASAP